MKLSEIRALNVGDALLTLDGRRVTYAGTAYGPGATRSRCTYAVVQNGDGSRSMELPANLTRPTSETAFQDEDLTARIERLIFIAMEPDPATRVGMTLLAATCKVAQDVQDEARAKDWEPHLIRAIHIYALKVGAAIGRRAITRGIVTRDQLLN